MWKTFVTPFYGSVWGRERFLRIQKVLTIDFTLKVKSLGIKRSHQQNGKMNCKLWEDVWDTCDWQRVLYPQYIKSSYNLIVKRQMIPFKKQEKYLNRRFFKEDIHMANKHRNRFSISLIISEMQIKTTPFPTTWMMRIINTDNTCWWGYGQITTLTHCWWECKTVVTFGKQSSSSSNGET